MSETHGEVELCRLCTNLLADQFIVEKLFERNQRKLLGQIEDLIGQRLKNANYLPQHICKSCEEQTLQAHAFRTQCIRAQQHFFIQKKKKSSPRKVKEEVHPVEEVQPVEEIQPVEVQPVEELVFNVITSVKEEKEPLESTESILPLLLHNTELLFKHELLTTNSDDELKADDSDGFSFNPLDDDQNATTYEDEEYEEHEEEENEEENLRQEQDKDKEPKSEIKQDVMNLEPKIKQDVMNLIPEINLFTLKPQIKKKSYYIKKIKVEKTKRIVSNEEKSFICDQCGKNFKVNSLLETHLRRHRGEKMFKCEICGDSFFLNADLKRHMRKHTGELPYPCAHCERRFMDHGTAKKHMRTHTNERPYICQQCGKAFTVAHTLTNHMLSHTNERAFSCKMCNVAFKRKTHLVTHYRSMTHKQNEEKHQMNMNNHMNMNNQMNINT